MQIGGCANYSERLFPLCNLYLVLILSLRGLLPLRALIGNNHSNLLVVFLGLTLLGLRVIAIGHLSQKHPLWLAIWQERERERDRQISETERNDKGYFHFWRPGTCECWSRASSMCFEFTWERRAMKSFDKEDWNLRKQGSHLPWRLLL